MKILKSQLKELICKIISENWSSPPKLGGEDASIIEPEETNEAPEIGSLAATPKAKNFIKQMHNLVSKELSVSTTD